MSVARTRGFELVVGDRGWAVPWIALAWGVLAAPLVLLRLAGLGDLPLAPAEAAVALEAQALHLGTHIDYRSAPLVPNLLSTWFSLFTPGDGQARAPVALAGILVCLTPWLYRPWLGSGGALLASGLLAFSPLGVLASRTVEGTALAVLAVSIGVAAALRACHEQDGRWLLAVGGALGVGLGAGPEFVGAAAAAVLAGALVPPLSAGLPWALARAWVVRAAVVGAALALLLDTRFLTRPPGLQAGLVEPLTDWLRGLSLARRDGLPLALGLAHEPLLLALALVGAVGAVRGRFGRFLLAWVVLSVLLGLLGSGSPLSALATATLPLALLASAALRRLQWLARLRSPGVAVTVVCLLAPLGWAVLESNRFVYNDTFSNAPLALASGVLIVVRLIARTWLRVPDIGAAFGAALVLVVALGQLSFLTRVNFAGHERAAPIFGTATARPELRLVERQAHDWWRQDPDAPVEVDASLRPTVEWALRDGPPVRWIQGPPENGRRALLGRELAGARGEGRWVRVVVAERYQAGTQELTPRTLWRWLAQRKSLFRNETDAILYQR